MPKKYKDFEELQRITKVEDKSWEKQRNFETWVKRAITPDFGEGCVMSWKMSKTQANLENEQNKKPEKLWNVGEAC